MPERIIPTVSELPKGGPARNVVADQIHKARAKDQASRQTSFERDDGRPSKRPEKGWINDRRGSEYITSLQGLAGTFEYVRGLDSNLVLDIGTGISRGISEIAKSDLGEGLEFKATSVTLQPDFDKYLGKDKVILTSAEVLRGVENNSVGCILALHSVSYSALPYNVIARMDQVLVEGGVIKMMTDNKEMQNKHLGEKTAKLFVDALEMLGYDVKLSEKGNVILAIKPFKNKTDHSEQTTKNIMQNDLESVFKWYNLLKNNNSITLPTS